MIFQITYPDVTFNIDTSNTVRNLIADKIDIAIRTSPQLPNSDLKAIKLYDYEQIICASPNYLANSKPLTSAEQLVEHDCITTQSNKWTLSKNNKQATVKLKPRFSVSQYNVQKQLALADCGIVILPQPLIQAELASKKLIKLLPDVRVEAGALWLLHPFQYHLPKRIRLLIDFSQQSSFT